MEKEIRNITATELRVKRDDDGVPKIAGYAARFNKWSDDLGGFREKIAPGAFTETLKTADVRALFNHDPNLIIGRTSAGTLRLKEDRKGLFMEVDPPNSAWAQGLVESIERGDVQEQSFAFQTLVDEWNEKKNPVERTLKEVRLMDVSPVTYPAYPDTSVALRSLETFKSQTRDSDEDAEPEDDNPTISMAQLDLNEAELIVNHQITEKDLQP